MEGLQDPYQGKAIPFRGGEFFFRALEGPRLEPIGIPFLLGFHFRQASSHLIRTRISIDRVREISDMERQDGWLADSRQYLQEFSWSFVAQLVELVRRYFVKPSCKWRFNSRVPGHEDQVHVRYANPRTNSLRSCFLDARIRPTIVWAMWQL